MRDIANENQVGASDSQVGDFAIVGISPDAPDKQKKFADKHSLQYQLLSDADKKAAEAFGVWQEKKLYGRSFLGVVRSAFLIDPQGKIAATFYKVSPKDTPVKLMRALQEA